MRTDNIQKEPISAALAMMLTLWFFDSATHVNAHGYLDNPKARQAICQAQGGYWWPETGENIPNLACRAAYLATGYVQFIQEHEFSVNVADYNNQAAVIEHVPDGYLCSGGSAEKAGMNLASPHWQKTQVTPDLDNNIAVKFLATTPHNPSFWQFYLSKSDFNPDLDILSWSALELVQSYDNVDDIIGSDGNRYYEMAVNIPASRSGDAILYTRWQRVDVVGEGFYNCSDITITRDDVDPERWQALGYFVRQGQTPQPGESVWARLFNGEGQEIINQHFAVNDFNNQNWQQLFAAQLVLNFPQNIQIGVKDPDGGITFDEQNVLSNQVWAIDKNHSFTLSVQATPVNTAPVVADLPDIIVDEKSLVSIQAAATDDEQTELSYDWQLPRELPFSAEGALITINTPEVALDTDFTVSVNVSDGELSTSKDFILTVKNGVTQPGLPLWNAEQTYVAGDLVSYLSKNYRAKWWTLNEKPDAADVWEKYLANVKLR